MPRWIGILLVLFATGAAGATELAGNDVIIPIVGRGPGAFGSEWRTDVVLTHVARRDIEPPSHVTLTLWRPGEPDKVVAFQLDPTASVVLDDALLMIFGVAEGSGMLRVTTTGSPAARVAARARIYNVRSSGGQYGLVVSGVPAPALGRVQLLPALRATAGTRTNVGVANPGDASVLVFVTPYEELTGEQRASFSVVIPPRSVWRWDDVFAPHGFRLPGAATLRISSNEPVYAFASVIDNESGDPDFIMGTNVPSDPQ